MNKPRWIISERGSVRLYPGFIEPDVGAAIAADLIATVPWASESMQMFGRTVTVPRLLAWYADAGVSYRYSGIDHQPLEWTAPLRELRARVESVCSKRFNGVLLNLYRTGADSMGWHSDDEAELGQQPTIASVSLGGTRRFLLRDNRVPSTTVDTSLTHGSLLVMKGDTQRYWRHCVPKTRRSVEPRLNLTFRLIF